MSDDIAKQRFWSENRAKPDPRSGLPRVPRQRSSRRALSGNAAATHVLMVRKAGHREWLVVADREARRIADVAGSEACCNAEMATRSRHWPDDEFRVSSLVEATKELRRKTWSVRDTDHIKNGERVVLKVEPNVLHPSLDRVSDVFGIPSTDNRTRTGTVKRRDRRTGDYMVHIDGGGLSISVEREDLIYPVPDNVIVLEIGRK